MNNYKFTSYDYNNQIILWDIKYDDSLVALKFSRDKRTQNKSNQY